MPPGNRACWCGAHECSNSLRQAAAFISSPRAQGVSFRQLAVELNALGFTAPRGGTFNQKQVQRLSERLPVAGKNSASEEHIAPAER